MTLAQGMLGSKGGWLSSLARRVASKQQQQQQGEQHPDPAHLDQNHPTLFAMHALHAAATEGRDQDRPVRPNLPFADIPTSGRPALRRLPSDAGFFDQLEDLTMNKSPKPEAPTGYRAWYMLLREKVHLKDMNEGWAPRHNGPSGSDNARNL